MFGDAPIQLLHQFKCHRLLTFQSIRIKGVQKISREFADHFMQNSQASIKIRAQLQNICAVLQSLRQLSGGNLSGWQKDDALHFRAGGICSDRSRRISRGSATNPGKSFSLCHGDGGGNSCVLE